MIKMRKFDFFILLLVISFGILSTLSLASIYLTNYTTNSSQTDWTNEMWCMGGITPNGTISQSSLWLIPIGLAGIAIVGVIGAVYFFIFPEMKTETQVNKNYNASKLAPNELSNSYSAVYKTLKPDEKKVLEVLSTHDGKYLQKYIRQEAGLSRLKVHRILARLAERGIVSLKKSGNTNEVTLADWLKTKNDNI